MKLGYSCRITQQRDPGISEDGVPAPVGNSEVINQAFSVSGALSAQAGVHRFYNDTGRALLIQSLRASVGTVPIGGSILVDVKIDGLSIFGTTPKLSIADSQFSTGKIILMDTNVWPDGSYVTVDIDQVGTAQKGSDLSFQIRAS